MPEAEALLAELAAEAPLAGWLGAAERLGLPDWALGAGAVRDAVWARLTGRAAGAPADLDLVFFDDRDVSPRRERAAEAALGRLCPGPWSVRNQARMHLRNGDRPYRSTLDAMGFWLETPTAVALRLEAGSLSILAPFGLGDLMGLRVCPTPRGREKAEAYRARLAAKDWTARWPELALEWP